MTEQRVWWIDGGEDSHEYGEFHKATLKWVTSLGLDPNWLVPYAEVVDRDGVFEFRSERVVPDEATGKPQFDPNNLDSLLTAPVVVQIQGNSWPARPAGMNV